MIPSLPSGGVIMVIWWPPYGPLVVPSWFSRGGTIIFSRGGPLMHVPLVVLWWYHHNPLVILWSLPSWSSGGAIMIIWWSPYGPLMVPSWFSRGCTIMVLSWSLHCPLVIPSWSSDDCLPIFVGLYVSLLRSPCCSGGPRSLSFDG